MNKQIFLLLLFVVFFIPIVNATQTIENHNVTFEGSQSSTPKGCMAITIKNDNLKLINVSVWTGVTAQNAYIFVPTPNGTIIANASISGTGGSAVFNLNLNKSMKYWVCVNNTVGSFTEKYTTINWPVYPKAGTNINWSGVWSGNQEYTITNPAFGWDIANITLDTVQNTVVSASPLNGSSFNTQSLQINATVNTTNAFYNVSLIIGTIINQTVFNLTNNTLLTQFNLTFNATAEMNFSYFISVVAADGSVTNTTHAKIFIDNVFPNINYYTPSALNTTIASNTFTSNISVSDPNLWSWFYNLTLSNGSLIYSINRTSLTGGTANINNVTNITNYGGVIISNVLVCDGHTTKEIKEYKNIITSDTLNFDTDKENIKVYLKDKNKNKKVSTEKKTDRYSFKFETKQPSSYETFVVESDEDIFIPDSTGYKGHLVIGKKWVDFEGENSLYVSVSRINKNKVEVLVLSGVDTSIWEFSSVGDLNCNSETAKFYSVLATTTQTATVLKQSSQTQTLTLSYDTNYITLPITAQLNYNGSTKTATAIDTGSNYIFTTIFDSPDVSTNGTVSYNWSYVINGQTYYSQQLTQTIYNYFIGNCTTYSTPFLNVTFRDEETNAIIETDWTAYFTVGDKTYSTSNTNSNNVSFCLSPDFMNLSGTAQIHYLKTAYDTRDFIDNNYYFDNSVDVQNLYLLLTASSGQVIINIKDKNSNDLENILVKSYIKNILTNNFSLVDTETSDGNGNAYFNLQLNSEFYKFVFYQDGVEVESTNAFKVIATTYPYVLGGTSTTLLGEKIDLQNTLRWKLQYINSTKLINFTWADTGLNGYVYCLNVTSTNTSYYGGCVTNDNSSLTYTITTMNISYSAYATVTTPNNFFVLDMLSIDTRTNWHVFGKETGLTLTIILMLVMMLIGVSSGNVFITFIITGVGASLVYLFGMVPMTWQTLTTIIILGFIGIVISARYKGYGK